MNENRVELPEAFPAKIDLEYGLKIVRRNLRLASIVAGIVAVVGVLATMRARDIYRSTVTAAFDRRDALVLGFDSTVAPAAAGIESSFQARFADAEFLNKLTEFVGIDTLGRLSRLLSSLGLQNAESESDRRARLVAYYAKRIVPQVNSGAGLLTLEVLLDGTAEKSQDLASTAMEMFITAELGAAADRMAAKADVLERALSTSRARLRDLQTAATDSANERQGGQRPMPTKSGSPATASTAGDAAPQQREVDLLDRIKIAEREFTSINDDFVRRRNLLEADYQRLSSRLSPNHPELLAKRRELDGVLTGPDPSEAAGRNLSRLRRELLLTRTTAAASLTGVLSGDSFTSLEERVEANHLVSLEQALADVNLERENLRRQMAEVGQRTRIRVIRPATFDIKPASRTKLKVGGASFALVLMTFFGVIVYREAVSKLARDGWRVERFVRNEVIAQISRENIDRYRRITPQYSDELRTELNATKASIASDKVRTLLAYRQVELVLKRKCRGRVVCLASAGSADATSDFLFSLANVLVTDGAGRVLVVDGDSVDPITSSSVEVDFVDCLIDAGDIQKAIKIADGDQAFDLISVTRAIAGERTRAFQEERIRRLLQKLCASYDLILVRSLPERLFIENAAIASVATDLIMCVDARRTTFAELARTIGQLGSEKLRGLVLIGT